MDNSPASTSRHTTTHHHHHPSPPPTPNNPYPTTFVQADTTSFKQVVQMLTGSSETAKHAATTKHPIPPMKLGPTKKPSKLYERRSNLKNFKINPLTSKFTNEILSPSSLDFPKLILSPVTPLISDPFNRSPVTETSPELDVGAEEKAIAEKGFYLHPSPATTPREVEPQLLPLFPLTSPRVHE